MFSIRKLLGQDDKFFDLLEASAQQADSSVHELVALLAQVEHGASPQSLEAFVHSRREDKRITQELTEQLCKTFITPLEREVKLSDDFLRVLVTRADHLNQQEMEAVEPQPIIREERPAFGYGGGGFGGDRGGFGGDRGERGGFGERGDRAPRGPRREEGAPAEAGFAEKE